MRAWQTRQPYQSTNRRIDESTNRRIGKSITQRTQERRINMQKQRGELIGGVVERVYGASGETLGVWFSAAEAGDEATLEKLAAKNPKLVHARHPLKSGSALWLAVQWKRLDAARCLLSH